jgi:ribosomal protein S27E
MKVDLPDEKGNVISLEVVRESIYYRRLKKTCPHQAVTIDPLLSQIECRTCGEKLNPVEWLAMMAEEWGRVKRMYEDLITVRDEVETRQRVKCKHCGRLTPISRPRGQLTPIK